MKSGASDTVTDVIEVAKKLLAFLEEVDAL